MSEWRYQPGNTSHSPGWAEEEVCAESSSGNVSPPTQQRWEKMSHKGVVQLENVNTWYCRRARSPRNALFEMNPQQSPRGSTYGLLLIYYVFSAASVVWSCACLYALK